MALKTFTGLILNNKNVQNIKADKEQTTPLCKNIHIKRNWWHDFVTAPHHFTGLGRRN